MVEFLNRIKRSFNKLGAKGLFRNLIVIIFSPLFSIRYIYIFDIEKNNYLNLGKDRYLLLKGTMKDLDQLFNNNHPEISGTRYDYLKNVIETPETSFYIIEDKNGNKMGYGCLELGNGPHEGIFKKIKRIDTPSSGYLYRDYTFNDFRRRGVHQYLVAKRVGILKEKGYKTATTRIAFTNTGSRASYEKIGFKKTFLEVDFHFFHILKNPRYLIFQIRGSNGYKDNRQPGS